MMLLLINLNAFYSTQKKTSSAANLLSTFLAAFRDGDPEGIFLAYNSMNETGISVNKVERVGNLLYFYFRDPDGNLLMVTSN